MAVNELNKSRRVERSGYRDSSIIIIKSKVTSGMVVGFRIGVKVETDDTTQ